jgi:phosphoribosyl 1,2-cyclic phosphodiesterase
MIITLWGTRGSLACSGPEMTKYGGNTSCVQISGMGDSTLILDAGTGIRRLGQALEKKIKKVDILLTHLHLDHIQGLGFFAPLFDPTMEVHIYGPATSNRHLHFLLSKYLSPPLFPVLLSDLPCKLYLHKIPEDEFTIDNFTVKGEMVCHPGITYGYRISSNASSVTYLPDHEPALGVPAFPLAPAWTSGYDISANADLLLHDAQYTPQEYKERVGWGHSTLEQAIVFAELAKVKTLIPFHYDPCHDDKQLDDILSTMIERRRPAFKIQPGLEGSAFSLP